MDDEERKVRSKGRVVMVKPIFRKVQVVYYLSKNGQLEQPHFVEVTHLLHQQLRLKDVMERLSLLRGRGMPSLYSWSCKRSYKNGYVWNDLGENDVICSSEGDEYVLKGSELLLLTSNDKTERSQNRRSKFNEEEEMVEYEEKRISYTNTPSRISRGVSTDEIHTKSTPPLTNPNSSPPSLSTTSGDTSKRFEDGDPDPPPLSRNSLLLHFMGCGGGVGYTKGKIDQPPPSAARKSSCSGSFHKEVVCKAAAATVEDEIGCMSENPRFGNLQSEEKEYFSGSIVEAINGDRTQVEPLMKKSNSYNEERSSKAAMSMAETEGDEEEEEEMKREKALMMTIGKCIPIKKFSSKPVKI